MHSKVLRKRLYIASLASAYAVMRFPVANNRSDHDDEHHNYFNIIYIAKKQTLYIYRSLGKIRREKIFVGCHVRRKLNTKILLPQRNRVVYNGL